jgi:xanthine dioxygenase
VTSRGPNSVNIKGIHTSRCQSGTYQTLMTIEFTPLALPASADASKFVDFGREVKGVDPGTLTQEQFQVIQEALYKVSRYHLSQLYLSHRQSRYRQYDALLFRDVVLSPAQQYALTKVSLQSS